MSASLSYKDGENKIATVDYHTLLKFYVEERKTSLTKLSVLINKSPSFIRLQLKRGTIDMPLMYVLSCHLSTNLMEPYQNLLPENIRPTRQEKALQQQIADLQKQLEEVKKERDLYKEIAMK